MIVDNEYDFIAKLNLTLILNELIFSLILAKIIIVFDEKQIKLFLFNDKNFNTLMLWAKNKLLELENIFKSSDLKLMIC